MFLAARLIGKPRGITGQARPDPDLRLGEVHAALSHNQLRDQGRTKARTALPERQRLRAVVVEDLQVEDAVAVPQRIEDMPRGRPGQIERLPVVVRVQERGAGHAALLYPDQVRAVEADGQETDHAVGDDAVEVPLRADRELLDDEGRDTRTAQLDEDG